MADGRAGAHGPGRGGLGDLVVDEMGRGKERGAFHLNEVLQGGCAGPQVSHSFTAPGVHVRRTNILTIVD